MSVSSDKDDPIDQSSSDAEVSDFDLSSEIEKMEIQLIMNALKKHNGDMQNTADELGVSLDYLKMKMQKI